MPASLGTTGIASSPAGPRRNTTRQPRDHRPSPIAGHNEATSLQRLGEGTALVDCGRASLLALGLHLAHQATWRGSGGWPRHAPYGRGRLGNLTLWRRQGTRSTAVGPGLPPCGLRSRQRRPAVARATLVATPGGLSLARCAGLYPLSPMARYRLLWTVGPQRLVTVLRRGGRALPPDFLADEQHRRCLTDTGSLPPLVWGRVLWPLGYPAAARAAAWPPAAGECPHAAAQQEPADRVRGLLPDGVARPPRRRRPLGPGARLGHCRRPALRKRPKHLPASAAPGRPARRSQWHPLGYRARQRQGGRVLALRHRRRHCAADGVYTAGMGHGKHGRRWVHEKTAGRSAVLAAPQRPAPSPL